MTVSASVSPMARRSAATAQKSKRSVRRSSTLPPETVDYLKAWMMSPEHIAHPYPTEQEKAEIMADTGIELKQLTNWFVNNRKRFWKPRVEARLHQQQAQMSATATAVSKVVVSPTKSTAQPPPSSGTRYITLDMTRPSSKAPVTPDRHDVVPVNDSGATVVNSAFVSLDRSRSPRAVSIGSSSLCSVSDESSLSNETDDDFSNGDVVEEVDSDSKTITRTETLDVHILRPMGVNPIPTIEDVTILTNVPPDRIMKTFEGCTLSYRFPADDGHGDRKKAQSRRDSEIVKMKKHYLKRFVAETAAAAGGFSIPEESPKTETASRKRPRSDDEDDCVAERPNYLRKCTDLWRDACRTANDLYDRDLPSLEEASHLFGYSVV